MSVRAKFRLNRFESTMMMQPKPKAEGQPQEYESVEMRSFYFHPAYSSDPSSENAKFWQASPNGELRMGVVNQGVWPLFKLGQDYYLDFSPADDPTT
jgi:hypothetical protein